MDLGQFIRLIETHGSDIARWPEKQRRGGAAFAERSTAARQALDDARRLETLFAEDRVVLDDARRQAIVTAAMRRVRTLPRPAERDWAGSSWAGNGWGWLFAPRFGAAFATMLVAGVLVGFAVTVPTAKPHTEGLAGIDALLDPAGSGMEGLIQ